MDQVANYAQGIITGLLNFYNSTFFAFVKFIVGIYVVVVLADIVLLLFQRGLSVNIKEARLGMNMPRELVRKKSRDKFRIKWENIKKLLDSDDEAQYKIAVIKGDDLINDLIKRMAFPGADTAERLAGINSGQIENIEDIKKAHLVKNRIIHDESFALTKEQTQEVLSIYDEFLKYHEVIE
jgi:hypothetical protein